MRLIVNSEFAFPRFSIAFLQPMCYFLSEVIPMSSVGERIKLRRKQLGISADDLAQRIGVSRSTVFRWEKGDIEKVPGDTLVPIAKALNVSPAFLMGWEELPPETNQSAPISGSGSKLDVFMSIVNQLSAENQEKALSYVEFLRDSEHK